MCSFHAGKILKRFLAIGLVMTAFLATPVSAEETYQVEILETNGNGFIHPGVGLTKAILENARAQIQAKQEPWYSYYQAMLVSNAASKTVVSSNADPNDPAKPASRSFNSQGINSRFISDGLKAYTQALMYYFTGDEVYRRNAMNIIRIWSQMDPGQYVYFTDAHIHTGIPLNRMVTAAEILRYTSYRDPDFAWTEADTRNFTDNLINPVIETFLHDNNHFMNQHLYPLLGAIAGYIFTDNAERFEEAVEWATVNRTALNQGFNGSIQRLFRLIEKNDATGEWLDEPRVQHMEMGRDQAHAAGDLTNAAILARMFYAQGVKVDPEDGTLSNDPDAVGFYEFLDDRILKAADYFWQFMLGYDTPWTPAAYSIFPDGEVKGIYYKISDLYKGRTNTALFWDMYYYYKYTRGMDVETVAPYFHEAFVKRNPSNYYYRGVLTQAWESVDGGGDFWLYIPHEAAAEGAAYLPKEQSPHYVELEERYTAFDAHTATVDTPEGSYVEFQAVPEGSKIAVHNLAFANSDTQSLVGLKFKSNGQAVLELSTGFDKKPYHTLILPDTQDEWKYIVFDMGVNTVSYGQLYGDFSLVYMKVKGNNSTVGIDHFYTAADQLTPPVFNAGSADETIYAFVGPTLHLDFSASDPDSEDVVRYSGANLPDGAVLDEASGQFVWTPDREGTYRFIIEASDSTAISVKQVTVIVAQDRASALQSVTALHDPEQQYERESLEAYLDRLAETNDLLDQGSDEAFVEQLGRLQTAAKGLRLLTPLLEDGSMDYTTIVTSTFGDSISLLTDNNDNTFPVYSLAPDLYHIVDFGPDYKVSAQAFGFEGRMNFDDRMAGIAVFASNDGVNWTRITPGETEYTSEMSVIEVAEPFNQQQYRLFKIHMINPHPDALRGQILNLLELSEFRIWGQRHEVLNKLDSVSIGSDQSLMGRIVTGDTIRLTFAAEEEIYNVHVHIQGRAAEVHTEDHKTFTASVVADATMPEGPVRFSIDYTTSDDRQGDTAYFTTDDSRLFLADETNLIGNVLEVANLIDSTNGRPVSETLKQTGYLFDNKAETFSDYRLNGSGAGSYVVFDFKEANFVHLTKVELLARQDQYYTRIRGTVVQGSNDNETWTTISPSAVSTREWQQLAITGTDAYRYIRIYNPNAWFGNMAEIRLHGSVTETSGLESVSIGSEQSIRGRITTGSEVTLTFKAKAEILDVRVLIQGRPATVNTEDNIHFAATAVMEEGTPFGPVAFRIDYKLQDGSDGFPITTTTDMSALYLADERRLVDAVNLAELIDSTSNRSAGETLKQVNYLFDGNSNTNSDFRIGTNNSGQGSYIIFDFGEDDGIRLAAVEMLARQDQYYTRLKGTVVQGSNDLAAWTNLTVAADSTLEWQYFEVHDPGVYRYIRIYNSGNWFGNMAELRLHRFPPMCTVKFHANGGTEIPEQTVECGGMAAEPDAPTKADHVFAGWYLDNGTFEQAWDFAQDTVPDGGVELYAKWIMLAPDAPVITSAAAGDGMVALSWTAAARAAGYRIYASETAGDYGDFLASVSDLEYTVTGLANGTKYYFVVTAFNEGGESGHTNEVSATPQVPAPGAPVLQSAAPGDRQVRLAWSPAPGAEAYVIYVSTDEKDYGMEAGTVSASVYEYVVTGLTNRTAYYFTAAARNPGGIAYSNTLMAVPIAVPAAPANVRAEAGNGLAMVHFDPPADDGGSQIVKYVVTDPDGNVVAEGTFSPIEVTGLTNGQTYRFIVHAVNAAGRGPGSDPSNAVTPEAPPAGGGHGDDDDQEEPGEGNNNDDEQNGPGVGNNNEDDQHDPGEDNNDDDQNGFDDGGSGNTNQDGQGPGTGNPSDDADEKQDRNDVNDAIVLVNGRPVGVEITASETDDGRQVTAFVLEPEWVDAFLAEEERGAVITIRAMTSSPAVAGLLNGQTVKDMAEHEAAVRFVTDAGSYTMPAQLVPVDELAQRFGPDAAFQEIRIAVEISAAADEERERIERALRDQGYTMAVPPVQFTVRAEYEGNAVEVTAFGGYVELTIAIPEGTDPGRITTAVVIEPDGTVRHVPTKIMEVDGRMAAVINSMTNSAYALVRIPVHFSDMTGHWAEAAVLDMGTRMIVRGTGDGGFDPDRPMTRAEFAAVIVRALGLKAPDPDDRALPFRDVKRQDWFSEAARTARAYGLVSGTGGSAFRPSDPITREQAMVIMAKAMAITGLAEKIERLPDELVLGGYRDAGKVSVWARSEAALNLQAGIVTGRGDAELAPQAVITRAEVAVMAQRLLQRSGLI